LCQGCPHRFRLLAGTIFHRTKLPLWKWFRAAFLLRFRGTNASNLAPLLEVTYRTSWLLCHKLRFAMGAIQDFRRRCADAVVEGPPLRLLAERSPEDPEPHGCERLERPDLAERTDTDDYPWESWLRERGPFPAESRLADEVRVQLRSQYRFSIGERYLRLYLDEFAFRWDRRWLGLWRFFADIADLLPRVVSRTRRQLGDLPTPRPVRPWLALRERLALAL
jgi:hypothetical protein